MDPEVGECWDGAEEWRDTDEVSDFYHHSAIAVCVFQR